ncbi:hypothetical protein Q8A67_007201 [Cirrhinus molitorella]|uniref:Uncharacterized protein n=1 Tax=Cirrhinus molitorella TaxID=172907 RepID=A0AA88Q3F0_9TELE|nr:hypothetical protein Q8A67_007201 [Cirrhinus molitorella]
MTSGGVCWCHRLKTPQLQKVKAHGRAGVRERKRTSHKVRKKSSKQNSPISCTADAFIWRYKGEGPDEQLRYEEGQFGDGRILGNLRQWLGKCIRSLRNVLLASSYEDNRSPAHGYSKQMKEREIKTYILTAVNVAYVITRLGSDVTAKVKGSDIVPPRYIPIGCY